MFNRPTYKFLSSARGGIIFDISDHMDDYGQFHRRSDAVLFAKRFIVFSKLWLEKHGFSPVEIRIIPRWNHEKAGGYGYKCDPQSDLRERIFNDFLSPLNMGKEMSQWQGVSGTPNLETYAPGCVPK